MRTVKELRGGRQTPALAMSRMVRRANISRYAFAIPIMIFLAMIAVLAVGLRLDPKKVPSPLIGKPVPEFALPAVRGRTPGLYATDFRGSVSLVNAFASWCVACREEHPLLMELKRLGVV